MIIFRLGDGHTTAESTATVQSRFVGHTIDTLHVSYRDITVTIIAMVMATAVEGVVCEGRGERWRPKARRHMQVGILRLKGN